MMGQGEGATAREGVCVLAEGRCRSKTFHSPLLAGEGGAALGTMCSSSMAVVLAKEQELDLPCVLCVVCVSKYARAKCKQRAVCCCAPYR